jgi:SAM-dependent methyltransferase
MRLVALGTPSERLGLPEPLRTGDRVFDVVDDLVAYTSLDRDAVEALVQRATDDFRREWHLTPDPLRTDGWYYLSSRMYLFGNAVHLHETPRLVRKIAELAEGRSLALDFGGGTGNLALVLASLGLHVDYMEISALQKDFVRFRSARYGLADRLTVLDSWMPLQPDRYDLICAIDVVEHLPDPVAVLEESLLPSLATGGLLVEQSPFGVSRWNPMHHADPGIEQVMTDAGLHLVESSDGLRVWLRESRT